MSHYTSTTAYDEISALYDRVFEQNKPAWEMFAKQLQGLPESRVLDVASGPGEPGLTIAAKTGWPVTLSDADSGMVAKARQRSALPNVDCVLADASTLDSFEDSSYDVITCCYGIHALPRECVDAFYRVLKPGGLLLVSYWSDSHFVSLAQKLLEVVAGHVGPPPINPMACAQPGLVDEMLETRFRVVSTETGSYDFTYAADEAFDVMSVCARPTLTTLAQSDSTVWPRAKAAFDDHCRDRGYVKEDVYVLGPNEFKLVVAKKD